MCLSLSFFYGSAMLLNCALCTAWIVTDTHAGARTHTHADTATHLQKLRGDVLGAATQAGAQGSSRRAGQTHIRQARMPRTVQHDVLGLQVTVQNSLCVQVV